MVTPGSAPQAAVKAVAAVLEAAGCPDAAFDAAMLARQVLRRDPRLCFDPLTADQAAALAALAARRAAREPLQYICGSWDFLDFTLQVGPGVLCPRADTEVVAQAAADLLAGVSAPAVLDLCAGSGCLGLGVRRLCPAAHVTALEKSPDAWPWLTRNAAHALDGLNAGPAPYARPVPGDLFTYFETLPDGALDLIVSNPPYLTAGEMAALQPEVQAEPAMALDGGADGLAFYRAIARDYKAKLRAGGALALEIGWQQAADVTALLAQNGWRAIAVIKDYAGNDRCVTARR